MIETINKVFEFFNLDDISKNNKIIFNFLRLLNSERKDDEEEVEVVLDLELDPLIFISKRYYFFEYDLKEFLIW